MLNRTMKISRQQLYDEIWQVSVAGVARKYNLNYSKLIAKCKEFDIPFPPAGYWTRRSMGKDISREIIELPPSDIEYVELLLDKVNLTKQKKSVSDKSSVINEESKYDINSVSSTKVTSCTTVENKFVEFTNKEEIESLEQYDSRVLSFLNEEKRFQVLNVANSLVISNKKKLHKQLIKYKNSIIDGKQKEVQSRHYYNSRYNKPDNEPTFFNEMSNDTKPRAMQILDAIFCAVEKLGGKINEDLSIKIKNDTVRFRLCEGQTKVKHELTKQEAVELVEYNDKLKNNNWATKPQIKKYDYIYNGKLRIVFGEKNYIRDSKSEKLEERLGDILMI